MGMSYRADHTALAWADAKTAALYFDHVIPAHIPDLYRQDAGDPIYYEVLQGLLPQRLLDASKKTGVAEPMGDYVAHYLITFPQAVGLQSLDGGETLEERRRRWLPKTVDALATLVDSSGIDEFSVYGERLEPPADGETSDPCLVLSNLDLVDTGRLSWRQVLELRRDQDAVDRLRNLRRMVYKDYAGKSEAYIRDDIEFRLAEYQSATKLWGLPLQKGVLEIAMTGDALTAVGAVVALTLFGAPIAAAAAAGGAIAVGKAALALAQRKREIDLERRRNPMAYLAELKRLAP